MWRSLLAGFLGLVLAVVIIFAMELMGRLLYPMPEGTDPTDLNARAATLPVTAWLWLLLGYALGTFAGAWLAARIARRRGAIVALVIGGLLLVTSVMNMREFDHPVWFQIVCLAMFLPIAYLAARLAKPRLELKEPRPSGSAP